MYKQGKSKGTDRDSRKEIRSMPSRDHDPKAALPYRRISLCLRPVVNGKGLGAMYRIPIFQVKLVRDGSQAAEFKRVRGPGDVYQLLADYLEGAEREHFGVLLLDTQNQIRGIHTVTIGSLNATIVHPREVFKPAILASSAAVILFHNHPSGDPTPSGEDRKVTDQLRNAGELIGIEVLDHIVIGDGRYVSFSEKGLMEDSFPKPGKRHWCSPPLQATR